MKFLVVLFFIVGICATLYVFIIHLKHIQWKIVGVLAVFGLILLTLIGIMVYKSSKQPDSWCSSIHTTNTYPPAELKTAMDYFEKANFEYDRGDCKGAVADYTKSIGLNTKYPEAYNNKAYTEMRMGNYKDALTDLNKALELNPNYTNALMNRGDIHNYYFEVDKNAAIADYNKIISLGGQSGTSVCGHLFMAQNDIKNILTWLKMPFVIINCRTGTSK